MAISPIGAVVLQWHTQVKYLTKMPLVYLFGILALDRKAFSRIAPADQAEVRRIMTGVWREMDTLNRYDNRGREPAGFHDDVGDRAGFGEDPVDDAPVLHGRFQ